jgi:hypothetical protein
MGSLSADDKVCPDNLKAFEGQLEKKDDPSILMRGAPKKEFNFRAKDQQVGGNHYKGMAIQPFEYAMKNHLNAGQFGVLKYISRYKNKNGIEDLRKAKHFLELLAEEEYNEKL